MEGGKGRAGQAAGSLCEEQRRRQRQGLGPQEQGSAWSRFMLQLRRCQRHVRHMSAGGSLQSEDHPRSQMQSMPQPGPQKLRVPTESVKQQHRQRPHCSREPHGMTACAACWGSCVKHLYLHLHRLAHEWLGRWRAGSHVGRTPLQAALARCSMEKTFLHLYSGTEDVLGAKIWERAGPRL